MNTVLTVALVLLACVGLVHGLAWLGIRLSCKGNRIYRVFRVGGPEQDAGAQMTQMYACLQWESNPSRQECILYNAGLDANLLAECEKLAAGAGIRLVHTPEELLTLLQEAGTEKGRA